MKKLSIMLTILCLAGGAAFAQDAATKGAAGDKALLFNLNGLSQLGAGDFNGGAGMRYHFTPSLSARFSLGLNSSTKTTKTTNTGSTFADIKESSLGFSLAPGIEFWMVKNGPVTGYIGAQFSYAATSTTTENVSFIANTKIEVSSSTFGVGAFIGAQWFPWNNIGLGAEYQLGFSSTSGTTKTTASNGTTTERDSPSTTTISLGSANSLSFTLAIYW